MFPQAVKIYFIKQWELMTFKWKSQPAVAHTAVASDFGQVVGFRLFIGINVECKINIELVLTNKM